MTNNYMIYMHTFPNGKKYIGITCQKPQKRWQNGYGYEKQGLMWNAINKYKWHNIEHKILYTGLNKNEAEQKEIELIKEYKTNTREYGYNIANGGNIVGSTSQETKEKIRLWHIGRPRSEETKEKLRKANLGKHMSEEVKKKISKTLSEKSCGTNNPFYGRKHTEISIKKYSKPVICLETGVEYYSIRKAARENGIGESGIQKCIKSKQKTAGGLHWTYAKRGGLKDDKKNKSW